MTEIVCAIISLLILILYLTSSAWSRRLWPLTQEELREAEQRLAAAARRHDDPLLASLDIAFHDGLDAKPVDTDQKHLPSEDQKA